MTTHNKEKYKCILPNIEKEENQKETSYDGPTPLDLVSTLFSSATCSYRIEPYWTYEVNIDYLKFHKINILFKFQCIEYRYVMATTSSNFMKNVKEKRLKYKNITWVNGIKKKQPNWLKN